MDADLLPREAKYHVPAILLSDWQELRELFDLQCTALFTFQCW